MTSDTFKSKHYGSVFCGEAGHEARARLRKIGEAGVYPGYVIRVHTDNFIYLAQQSDAIVSGVAAAMEGYDLDTVYTSGVAIEYYAKGSGMRVYVFLVAASPAPAPQPGNDCYISTTDGMVMVYAYADGTNYTDSVLGRVGTFDEYVLGSVTDNKLIAVILD
jgi:hypothetical protein